MDNLGKSVLYFFEKTIHKTLYELPEDFLNRIDNVAFLVEDWPSPVQMNSLNMKNGLLFGLYQGVPLTKRTSQYSSLPDKITIFAGPLIMVSQSVDDLKLRINDTLYHEIGHFFGLNDFQIKSAQRA